MNIRIFPLRSNLYQYNINLTYPQDGKIPTVPFLTPDALASSPRTASVIRIANRLIVAGNAILVNERTEPSTLGLSVILIFLTSFLVTRSTMHIRGRSVVLTE
jgi:hypothetical protein